MKSKKKIHHLIVELAQIQGFLTGLSHAIITVSEQVRILKEELEGQQETPEKPIENKE